MNTKFEKVLDSRRSDANDLKRKLSDQRTSRSSSIHKPGKRAKFDGSNNKCGIFPFPSREHLLNYYSYFQKSGIVHRLMYYNNGEWNDFSQDVISFVNKDLLVEKPAVEIEVGESKILLDFLHMIQLDMNTAVHHPIAWIDVSGNCFFPEIVSDSFAEGHNVEGYEPEGSNINLHLEIAIGGLDNEANAEPNVMVEHVQAPSSTTLRGCDVENNDSCGKASHIECDEKCEFGRQMDRNVGIEVDLAHGSLDHDAVKELFFKAVSSDAAKIVEIRPCESTVMKCRLELFEKQVEITKRHRGDANVQYAWLPCSRDSVSTISQYGVGQYEPLKVKHLHGKGMHLIPANGTQFRTRYFDVDKNEMHHMVLYRVVMGKMEVVHPGSDQSLPCSEEFDSGVDKLLDPNFYVVWNMNSNSHLYPECIVSFQMMPDVGDAMPGEESKGSADNLRFAVGRGGPQGQIAQRAFQGRRQPQSPWIPFPMLFAAISNKVPSESMDIAKTYYILFKNKTITRDTFVRKLRIIFGDDILKSIILGLQPQPSCSSSGGESGSH